MTSRWWFYPALIAASLMLVMAGVAALTVVLLWPSLPSLEVLTDYRPKIPLRVYSADRELIGEFGEEKRAVVKIQDVPQVMKAAILAAEDDRFYQPGGVDYTGVARAKPPRWRGCPRRLRARIRSSIRSAPRSASATCCAACSRCVGCPRSSTRPRSPSRCASTGTSTRASLSAPTTSPRWPAPPSS